MVPEMSKNQAEAGTGLDGLRDKQAIRNVSNCREGASDEQATKCKHGLDGAKAEQAPSNVSNGMGEERVAPATRNPNNGLATRNPNESMGCMVQAMSKHQEIQAMA